MHLYLDGDKGIDTAECLGQADIKSELGIVHGRTARRNIIIGAGVEKN